MTRVPVEVSVDKAAKALPVTDTRATPPDCDIDIELVAFPEAVADRASGDSDVGCGTFEELGVSVTEIVSVAVEVMITEDMDIDVTTAG